MDIQRASTVSINKCMHVCICVCVCMYAYMHLYMYTYISIQNTHAHILYGEGGEGNEGETKLYGKMNGKYKEVH